MEEIWKDIPGYENKYRISNLGRVYSSCSNKILYQWKMRNGYYSVGLSEHGKVHTTLVHRLVAEAFLPNPDKLPCVNHIDGDKTNNNVDNLEWCTSKENNQHAYKNNLGNYVEKSSKALKIGYEVSKKKYGYLIVIVYHKDNPKDVKVFYNTKDASEYIGCSSKSSAINAVIKGRVNYIFNYKVIGYKNKDLINFANGEPLPDVLKGIPWKDQIIW